MKKKQSKVKKETPNLTKLKVLEDRIKEIQDKFTAMTPEEHKIIEELKIEINQIKNK